MMGRYQSAVKQFDFPDLSEDGDHIFVRIRNPKTVPMDKLTPRDVPMGADGKPDMAQATAATFDLIAGLIVDWHVYDGSLDEDSPPLPLPATGDMVKTLPMEIVTTIMEEVGKVLTPPQSPTP